MFADATAGLADAGWSSFRSYDNPTRWLLRIDSPSTATDRQDATFLVSPQRSLR